MERLFIKPQLNNSIPFARRLSLAACHSVFALFSASYLALSVFYAMALSVPVATAALAIGGAYLAAALLVPLMSYVAEKNRSLCFGANHPALIASAVFLSIFNAAFWSLGQFDQYPLLTAALLFVFCFAVQLSLTLFRSSLNNIEIKLLTNSAEIREGKILKNVFIMAGLMSAAFIFGLALTLNRPFDDIGFALSSITLAIALTAYLATFSYVPFLNLSGARESFYGQVKLKNIYKSFTQTAQGVSAFKRKLSGFVLSIFFYCAFFSGILISAYVFFNQSAVFASLCLLLALAAFFVGGAAFSKVFSKRPPIVIAAANAIFITAFVFVQLIYYTLFVFGVFAFNKYIFCGSCILSGLFASCLHIAADKLFIGKLSAKPPYNLKTLIYFFAICLSVILSGLFGWLFQMNFELNVILALFLAIQILSAVLSTVFCTPE